MRTDPDSQRKNCILGKKDQGPVTRRLSARADHLCHGFGKKGPVGPCDLISKALLEQAPTFLETRKWGVLVFSQVGLDSKSCSSGYRMWQYPFLLGCMSLVVSSNSHGFFSFKCVSL